jgi:hypothetical protein
MGRYIWFSTTIRAIAEGSFPAKQHGPESGLSRFRKGLLEFGNRSTDIPQATKMLAAEFALHCWNELTKDIILSASDFDETDGDDADDDSEDPDDGTFLDVEYGHDDVEEADLQLMMTAADDNENNNDD